MPKPPLPCATVLIVEDDESTRQMLCVLLEAEGHECVSVATGTEAIYACAARQFDCMLLDYSLGVMSGLSVAQRLGGSASIHRPRHVLLMTGHPKAEFSSALRDGIVDGHLQKPADLNVLAALVRGSVAPTA